MVLVDTSVWIEVFRRPSRVALDAWVDFGDVVTCPPVVQEVVQGFGEEVAFARARRAVTALPTRRTRPLRLLSGAFTPRPVIADTQPWPRR